MVQVGAKFSAFVSLPSLPAPSSSPCPLALSQELSSSTESIDNSFSSVSGARLGLGGRLPHGRISSPSPNLSPQAKAGVKRCRFSQASRTWRSPRPCCQHPGPRLGGLR